VKKNQIQNILLGVTGSVAAYKAAELARLLCKDGHRLKVVMTESAKHFIGATTFEAITGEPVLSHLFHEDNMAHIQLARWADCIVVAPASAHFIAQLAHGLCGDLLSTICVAASTPLFIAPAMNQQMWANPATQDNVEKLKGRGLSMIGPDFGTQACGETGLGCLSEPREIMERLLQKDRPLRGQSIVITAGPTFEDIDPVRFIGNKSSGKMGFALADVCAEMGAEVTLVSGPTTLIPSKAIQKVVSVRSALDMYQAVMKSIEGADVFISVAAVADYRPVEPATSKIKKKDKIITITLERTPDIVADVAKHNPKLFIIGFAAETDDILANAQKKLKEKKLDLMVVNQIEDGKPFGKEENAVWILSSHTKPQALSLRGKKSLAYEIMKSMISHQFS
jgi:phosphopantothenoylcysteine decarboxylase / phosphopantothenate---cysteine ligase